MLQIGPRRYELVRAHSGFHVTFDPGETGDLWRQSWQFDAHYLPADSDPGPALEDFWEYLRLMIRPLWITLNDWRDLANYHPTDFELGGFYPYSASLDNLLLRAFSTTTDPILIDPDEFRIIKRKGYHFTCEFEGILDNEDEKGEGDPQGDKDAASVEENETETILPELLLRDEIPLASATIRVPINSSDPVAAALAIAARELKLTDIARTHLTPYDPNSSTRFRSLGNDKHHVLLETPWRLRQA